MKTTAILVAGLLAASLAAAAPVEVTVTGVVEFNSINDPPLGNVQSNDPDWRHTKDSRSMVTVAKPRTATSSRVRSASVASGSNETTSGRHEPLWPIVTTIESSRRPSDPIPTVLGDIDTMSATHGTVVVVELVVDVEVSGVEMTVTVIAAVAVAPRSSSTVYSNVWVPNSYGGPSARTPTARPLANGTRSTGSDVGGGV